MNRLAEVLSDALTYIRQHWSTFTRQSERALLIGTVLLVSGVSVAVSYVLTQYYAVDVISSLTSFPADCSGGWTARVGRHCFGDYAMLVSAGLRPNPFDAYQMMPPHPALMIGAPPTGLLLPLFFGAIAKWLGWPLIGLISYMVALTIAVLSPGFWAARGACGLERMVIFGVLSVAAIPAWMVLDRGNTAGFVVPVALTYLIALRRRRWGLAATMVIVCALIKPQFVVLVISLVAARKWRLSSLVLTGVLASNIGVYMLWPRDFPETIAQSLRNTTSIATSFSLLADVRNVSFGRALMLLPDNIKMIHADGKLPEGFLQGPRSATGYVVCLLIVAFVLLLGRRIPPIMAGIVLLATAELSPPLVLYYHLVFVLPIAAVIVRDPGGARGAGIFDHYTAQGERRRPIGVCLSLAAAFTIAQLAIPGTISDAPIPGLIDTSRVVATTTFLTPFLWLIACLAILTSYARRPADCEPEFSPKESTLIPN